MGASAHTKGLRSVAVLEAVKGALVIAAGFGLLALIHHDVQHLADRLVRALPINPARHMPRIFLSAAEKLNDARLQMLALGAFVYSLVRLVEAWGLWNARTWAEWFAILSGAIYLPVEVYEFIERPSWVRASVFLVNLAIVGYLAWVRATAKGARA